MIHEDKTLYGLVAESFITKKSVQDLLIGYMNKKTPQLRGFVFTLV